MLSLAEKFKCMLVQDKKGKEFGNELYLWQKTTIWYLCKSSDIFIFNSQICIFFLKYALTDKPEVRPFDPQKTSTQEYPITSFQPVYFVADSFDDAKEKLK